MQAASNDLQHRQDFSGRSLARKAGIITKIASNQVWLWDSIFSDERQGTGLPSGGGRIRTFSVLARSVSVKNVRVAVLWASD